MKLMKDDCPPVRFLKGRSRKGQQLKATFHESERAEIHINPFIESFANGSTTLCWNLNAFSVL
jgi:hypothetical protein